MLVVDVDDADDRATGLEQQRLGPEVLLDGAVQVEVVTAEVGEDCGVEPGSVDPVQGEGVRRHLHHHRPVALVTKLGEAGLQLRRLGRRVGARQRADDARRVAGGTQDRGEEHARRRLAVGPGDADDPERRRRVAVDRRGDRAEGQPGVVDDELRDGADIHRPQGVVDEQRRRPGRDGRRGERVAVVVGATQAGVHPPRRDRRGVVGDRGHGEVVLALDNWMQRRWQHRAELAEGRDRTVLETSPAQFPSQSVEPGGGTMPSSWMIVGTSMRNVGAADWAPELNPLFGSSIEISTVTWGSSAGKKPTKLE